MTQSMLVHGHSHGRTDAHARTQTEGGGCVPVLCTSCALRTSIPPSHYNAHTAAALAQTKSSASTSHESAAGIAADINVRAQCARHAAICGAVDYVCSGHTNMLMDKKLWRKGQAAAANTPHVSSRILPVILKHTIVPLQCLGASLGSQNQSRTRRPAAAAAEFPRPQLQVGGLRLPH